MLLRDVSVGRRTGVLTILQGTGRWSLRFDEGRIVNLSTNVVEDRLGETLLRFGYISAAEFGCATEKMLRDGTRLGLAFHELGIIDEDRLQELLAVHVREIFPRVLELREPEYSFVDEPVPAEEDITLKVPTGELILEAVRRAESPAALRFALGDLSRVLRHTEDPLVRFQRLRLSPLDGFLLSRIDGIMTAAAVLEMAPADEEDAQRSLLALLCTGLVCYAEIESSSAPPAAVPLPLYEDALPDTPSRQAILDLYKRLPSLTFWEVLGLGETASGSEVRDAYVRLARRFHPDVHHQPWATDLRDQLGSIFVRLGEAHEVLRDPGTRAAYEQALAAREAPPPRPPLSAAEALAEVHRARGLIDHGRSQEAAPVLAQVIDVAQGAVLNHARVLLARVCLHEADGLRSAEELLRSVIEDDSQNIVAHFILADVYRRQGLKNRALTMFERVHDLVSHLGSEAGILYEGVLPTMLRAIYLERRTGLLSFALGEEMRAVRFRTGHAVNSRSNVKEERLGETLVRLGILKRTDLDHATERVVRESKRLGLVLLELDLLREEQLQEVLGLLVRETFVKVFSWHKASYSFCEEEVPPGEDITLRVSTGDLILEAARRIKDPNAVRYALGDLGRCLRLAADPLLRLQRVRLDPTQGYLLSRIDGVLTAREVLSLLPTPAAEAQRSLLALLCTGIVEHGDPPPRVVSAPRRVELSAPDPPPPPPPRPLPPTASAPIVGRAEALAFHRRLDRNHFEVLELSPDADDAKVREAYLRLACRFHPDLHHEPELADLQGKLEDIFLRLGEAYSEIGDADKRERYAARLTPLSVPSAPVASKPAAGAPQSAPADSAWIQGELRAAKKLLGDGQAATAVPILERVVEQSSGLLRRRAQVLLARALAFDRLRTRRAEEILRDVIHEAPGYADAHVGIGLLYRRLGMTGRAVASLRRALEIEPKHAEALAELTALGALPSRAAAK